MPSHKIHLAIAKKVNDKLNMDLDSIMLGSILPDMCEKKDHGLSHFQVWGTDLEGLANPDKFVNMYRKELNNPVMIGYLMHILADRYYNEYMFIHFYLYDENNNGIGMILKGKKKLIDEEKRKYLKHREFDIYEKWLMNHEYNYRFKDFKCIENVIDINGASFNKEKLKEYILKYNKDLDKRHRLCFYNFKITNKEELDNIYNGCIDYILEYLHNINK